jgi:hypothetical protein
VIALSYPVFPSINIKLMAILMRLTHRQHYLNCFVWRFLITIWLSILSGASVAKAESPNLNLDLKLNREIIENSPVLQRWLVNPPDILFDIKNTPSFNSKVRLGLTSRDQSLGFDVGLQDLFLGGTPATFSASFQREFSDRQTNLNGEFRYYLLPLGGYFNITPLVGYRYMNFFGESVSGVDLGIQGILVFSPRSSDLRLSQSFTSPLGDKETSITTLSTSYGLSNRLSLSSSIQWRRSPVGADSRVGFYLEWRL